MKMKLFCWILSVASGCCCQGWFYSLAFDSAWDIVKGLDQIPENADEEWTNNLQYKLLGKRRAK